MSLLIKAYGVWHFAKILPYDDEQFQKLKAVRTKYFNNKDQLLKLPLHLLLLYHLSKYWKWRPDL